MKKNASPMIIHHGKTITRQTIQTNKGHQFIYNTNSATTSGTIINGGTSFTINDDYTISGDGIIYWENSGLTERLSKEEQKELSELFDEIQRIHPDNNQYGKEIRTLSLVITRNIYTSICRGEKNLGILYFNPTKDEMVEYVGAISIKDIVNKVILLYKTLYPKLRESLTNIDSEAELCLLIANDYLLKLINEMKKEKDDVWDVFELLEVTDAYFIDITEDDTEIGHIEFTHKVTQDVIEFDIETSYDKKRDSFEYFDRESEKFGKKYGIKYDTETLNYILDAYDTKCNE